MDRPNYVPALKTKYTSIHSTLLIIAFMMGTIMSPTAFALDELVINEIIQNPSAVLDEFGEWFELYNPASSDVDINGWTMKDADLDTHVITNGGPLLVPAGGYLVLGKSSESLSNGGVTVAYVFPGNFYLGNGSDELILLDSGLTEIDRVEWDNGVTFPDPNGASMSLIDPGLNNNVGANWCMASTPYGAGDSGTPGGANDCPVGPPPATPPVINEFVANHTGADTGAFVEVFGDPSADYSAYTVLEIEGDGSGAGTIDAVLPVGITSASGYWVDSEDMENGTVTILLVEGFTGSKGDDLDTDNDGTFDSTPWTSIIDDVATTDGGGSDHSYSTTVLAAFFDGNAFGAGGASRIPNGVDTDTTGDWTRNDYDGFGFPGFPGSPALGEAENTPDAINMAITVATDPIGTCGDSSTFIYDIQGSDAASTDIGSIREVEGVVVGDFQTSAALRGYFMQDATGDGDAATSDGIFVYDGSSPAVDLSVGDAVRVRAAVTEFWGMTELTNVVSVMICGTDSVAATPLLLPVAASSDFEALEGMLVVLPQTLYASGNFNLARYGEVDLSVDGPLDSPTNVVAPGAPAIALQDLNNLSRIQMDDGRTSQNVVPTPYVGVDDTLRTGDSVTGVTAALGYSFGAYELHPTSAVGFVRENDRPVGSLDVGNSLLKVASFNVLNYFTTLDGSGSICGPDANQGCRGADDTDEFDRQREKLVSALSTLDADVVGLMELENATDDTPIADLVSGINDAFGAGTYTYIPTGAIGTDAIRQGLIYKSSAVTPVGGIAILDSSVDPDFLDDRNRPVLAQTFEENTSGERFTIAVNHLKSKGSNCNSLGDPDVGDGQGNCNLTRTTAAMALVDWLLTDPTASGDADFLIVGDLNAYAMEDPVMVIESGGYIDLIKSFVGTGFADGAYSYNFFSQSGYLDHALSSTAMTSEISGARHWHINSDEPSGLDYNSYNQGSGLYSPDQFRSSDHDAVVVGFLLDEDQDGVWDGVDQCPGTVIAEGVPTLSLGTNRFALVDNDMVFDTKLPEGKGPRFSLDIWDTAGCSCEQIIDEQDLGEGHTKYGCSIGAMKRWVESVD